MNGQREDNPSSCYFHPEEEFVGVCPLCLHERLVVLASRQNQHRRRTVSGSHARSQQSTNSSHCKKPLNLPKIFALGSLLNRLEFRHYWRSDSVDFDRDAASSPEEDSFISIKFENNGVASWEKKNTVNTVSKSKVSLDSCNVSWNHHSLTKVDAHKTTSAAAATTVTTTANNKSVIEHAKPRTGSLRWRKRIGHLFHLVRWKRSSKASVCHVGTKVEGVKVRSGWIRTLTKRGKE